jgi:hypothetical protein
MTLMTLKEQSTGVAEKRCKSDETEEAPIPPTIEHITGNYQKQILQATGLKHKPIEQKHYWQEKHEFKRIEKHIWLFLLLN